jgi:hypothetical protein
MPGPLESLRQSFSAQRARRVLIALLLLLALLILYLNAERARGLQAWTDYQTQAKAAAQWLDYTTFAQPPVPDDQNFAAAPLLQTLALSGNDAAAAPARDFQKRFDDLIPDDHVPNGFGDFGHWETAQPVDLQFWRDHWNTTDLLVPLKKFAAELSDFAAAARRPETRFPLEGEPTAPNLGALLDNLTRLTCLTELRALAELDQNLPGPAAADVTTLLRAAQRCAAAPEANYQMLAVDIQSGALPVLWQGLAQRRWDDAQLAALADELAALDLLASSHHAWQFEAAFSTAAFEQALGGPAAIPADNAALTGLTNIAARFPRGWLYQTMVGFRRYYDGGILACYDVAHHRLDLAAVVKVAKTESDITASWSPYNYLLKTLAPAHQSLMVVAEAQTGIDLARVACALERVRLATGHYPEKLDALVPAYTAALPPDIITGQPLIYKCDPGGDKFVLYSLGWNNQDDGGWVTPKLSDRWTEGDWTWSYEAQPKR